MGFSPKTNQYHNVSFNISIMSYVKIWIHFVFATKNRQPVLAKKIRLELFRHIRENTRKKSIWLDRINGYSDHAHCLISLGKDQSISKIAQLIKGESSNWLNKQGFFKTKFLWQDDYFAVSVAESQLNVIRTYIENQEDHHQIKQFSEEVDEFIAKYGWNKDKKELG